MSKPFVARRLFWVLVGFLLLPLLLLATLFEGARWMLVFLLPIALVGIYDVVQKKRSLLRNYPVVGHFRYWLESFRPEIQQYFVETNWQGRPYNRELRSIVYQRAKGELQTHPFGTQRDVYWVGHEWMNHSLAPLTPLKVEPRVRIGGDECKQPYEASHLNISAMSYGSLGVNAIRALNLGAKLGGFYHNTGEGGLSPYHLEDGGDLCWQIGTGYFGCRDEQGRFSAERFRDTSQNPSVKMIEIKLSQGAKPAHGGILPGKKVSHEIATIRGVPEGRDVISPPAHSTFSSPAGLLDFVADLRELSGGKPVGFKLCMGYRSQFLAICKAMTATEVLPDFIVIDGAEGGTGAAPLEFANSVGTPLREGLLTVHNALVGCGLRDKIRLIASGKVVTGFHILRAMALGADLCNGARSMMFALGCIQARRCNNNDCPVGVATTDPSLGYGLNVQDKARRVARYHHDTIEAFLDLVASAGLDHPARIRPSHICRRTAHNETSTFEDLYPYLSEGSLLNGSAPSDWLRDFEVAHW
ncbi:MAG: FMN-binding glutamate synthase family protein [Myxococcales bacterium]|nr:MAG: FMN-binding glutamate synthase family protein [Myxococcales bacterium]